MPNGFTLAEADRIADFAHYGQKDQAGFDYILHPRRVLDAVQQLGAPPYVQYAALLHDVPEDTKFKVPMLFDWDVPGATCDIVDLLDRGASEQRFLHSFGEWAGTAEAGSNDPDWHQYLRLRDGYYYQRIFENTGATLVKKCDIDDNSRGWRLSYLQKPKQKRLLDKYEWGMWILTTGQVPTYHYTDSRWDGV